MTGATGTGDATVDIASGAVAGLMLFNKFCICTGPLSASTEYRTLLGLAGKALVKLLIAWVAPGGKVMVTLSVSGVGAGLAGASGLDKGVGVGKNVSDGGGVNAGVAAVCEGTWAADKDGEGEGNIDGEVRAGIEMGVGVTGWEGNV